MNTTESPLESALKALASQLNQASIIAVKTELQRTDGAVASLQTQVAELAATVNALSTGVAPAQDDPPSTLRWGVGSSVRWQGDVWTISAEGKITRNGAPATTPDYTANVASIGVDEFKRLVHTNIAGDLRYFDGKPDWPLVRSGVRIEIAGALKAVR